MSRLPGLAGVANDAVSADAQVHTSEAPRLLRLAEKERPQEWTRLPPSRRPTQRDAFEEIEVPLERKRYGSSLAGLLWERKLKEAVLTQVWEKFQLGVVLMSTQITTILVRLCGRHQDGWRDTQMWDLFVKGHRPESSEPFAESGTFWLHPKRSRS